VVVTLSQGFRGWEQHFIFPEASKETKNQLMNFRNFMLIFKNENTLTRAVQLYVKADSII